MNKLKGIMSYNIFIILMIVGLGILSVLISKSIDSLIPIITFLMGLVIPFEKIKEGE